MKPDTISAGIAMTMLSLMLALPTAASEYALRIFGNANEDDTIDVQDLRYTEPSFKSVCDHREKQGGIES